MGKVIVLLTALSLVFGAVGTTGASTTNVTEDPILCSDPAFPQEGSGSSNAVPDFLGQLVGLKHHAEAIGWTLPEDEGAPDPDLSNHYQGICRYPGPGTPVLYVTQKEETDGGYLLVVRMASRPSDGERMRSNLQVKSEDTRWTRPPEDDRWIRSIHFNGRDVEVDGETLRTYVHPGGVAVEDNVLFVAMDQPKGDGFGSKGMIVLFDLGEGGECREDPRALRFLPLAHGIDNLGVTRLSDGQYLIWTNGDGGEETWFYKTNSTDLRDPNLRLEIVQEWDPNSDDFVSNGAGWPTGLGAHQGSAFVREGDGMTYPPEAPLYLIGMRKDNGKDFADIYRVVPNGDRYQMIHVRTLHFYCGLPDTTIDRICSFMGGNNAYVSPTGELILYSIQRDDEDWADVDFARMGEFRHREVNRPESPLRNPVAEPGGPYHVDEGGEVTLSGAGVPSADRPWVEIYKAKKGWDHAFEHPEGGEEGGRSIMVDYDDRDLLELDDFGNLDSFDDQAISVVWRMPVGLDAILYELPYSEGRRVILQGTGQTKFISDLGNDEKLDFSEEASSMKFDGAPPGDGALTLEWDLDGDGVCGETGTAAERGEEIGATPSFSAELVDGPTNVSVELQACDESSHCGQRPTTVHVHNVAPEVESGQIEDETGRSIDNGVMPVLLKALEYGLFGSFTDAGVMDTHTAEIDWGDGLSNHSSEEIFVFTDALDGETGTVNVPHAYASKGTYNIVLTVEDDDGDSGQAVWEVEVVDAVGALEKLIEALSSRLDGAGDAEKRLLKALEKLQGNKDGAGKNGALDLFEEGKPKQALKKISQALKEIERAAEDGSSLDLADIIDGLALVAKSQAAAAVLAAEAVASKPSDTKRVEEAKDLLAESDELLSSGDYAKAVDKYRKAFDKVKKYDGDE